MGYQKHFLIFLIILVLTRLISGSEAPESLVIASHCSSTCGGITIPYPFGIEEGCYYKDKDDNSPTTTMKIKCNHTFNPPKPILGRNIRILNISLQEGEIRLNNRISYSCNNPSGRWDSWMNLRTFTISSSKNMFLATGCDTYAWFKGKRYGKNYSTGCMTTCNEIDDVLVNGNICNGVGCCEASIPDGVTNITITAYSYNNHTQVKFNPCSAAYPVANDAFHFSQETLTRELSYYLNEKPWAPVVYNWGIGTKNCSEAEKVGSRILCKSNTECINLTHEQHGLDGYRCACKKGYSGNPYLPQGCQDIDECKGTNSCEKPGYCNNTIGDYNCVCPEGYHGIGNSTHRCISDISNTKKDSSLVPVIVTAGIGGVIIILLIISFIGYWRHEKRKMTTLREKNFRDNGGEILHQKVSGMDVLKIFTIQELENATNKYNEANIIGRGGFGVVYKGVISGNQPVAIKRSLKVDPNQVEQFINEVLVLSQINNRHVVKLLGCCLETEVPLLVYEFINNGTLFDHLQDEGKASCFTWNLRLKIALDIADVLSYLHTTISTPIIHRDMKSMNVLLDESYTAKVADFGASKIVPLDHGQIDTMVIGTQGYLDPEYMQTFELTEKSDVYSFGVVLLELLTKEKALSYGKPEAERCLAMYFLRKMKEDRLFDIVDKNITNDPKQVAQIKEVANLAKWCLRLKGDDRPTMKEAAMELEGIRRMGSQPKYKAEKSFDQLENSGNYMVGIAIDDDGNTNTNTSGKDSDLHSLPHFVSTLGDGR
ncbi:wall-associated receptor kinase 5-like [Silene latifolia]|uniref:wall-associated receptor kinase 5-like n=1 Tax=Silene latifolia TaxID=37657 RepID=UPI003D772D84